MIPDREREALMRLTMCAREECIMCKYHKECDFDFQYELATESMNILANALRKTEPNSSEKPNNCEDCIWSVCNYNKAFEDEPQNHSGEVTEMVKDELSVCDLCGIKNKGIPCGTEPRVCSKAISRAEQIEPRPETHDLRINTHACIEDKLQTIAEDINRRVKNAYRSCDMAEDEPSMEMSGVLTLTEESSNELFRVLEEQDKAYINDVLDGKCGFTIKSADGRSVELVPTQNKRNQRVQSVEACDMCCIQTEVGCEPTDCPWR